MRKGPELAFGAIDLTDLYAEIRLASIVMKVRRVHGYIMALLYQPHRNIFGKLFKAAVIVGYSSCSYDRNFHADVFIRLYFFLVIPVLVMPVSCHADEGGISSVPSVFVMPVFVKPTSCHADAGRHLSFFHALSLIMPVFVMPTSCHADVGGISSCPVCLCHACFLSCRRRRHLFVMPGNGHLFLSRLSLSCLFLVMPTQEGISSCPVCLCHACFLSCRRGRHLLLSRPLPLSRLSLSCLFLVMPLLVMPTQEASPPALSCPVCLCHACFLSCRRGEASSPFHALSLVMPVFVMPVSCHADEGGIPFVMPGNEASLLVPPVFVMPVSCHADAGGISPLQKPARIIPYLKQENFRHRYRYRCFCFNRNQSLIRLGK